MHARLCACCSTRCCPSGGYCRKSAATADEPPRDDETVLRSECSAQNVDLGPVSFAGVVDDEVSCWRCAVRLDAVGLDPPLGVASSLQVFLSPTVARILPFPPPHRLPKSGGSGSSVSSAAAQLHRRFLPCVVALATRIRCTQMLRRCPHPRCCRFAHAPHPLRLKAGVCAVATATPSTLAMSHLLCLCLCAHTCACVCVCAVGLIAAFFIVAGYFAWRGFRQWKKQHAIEVAVSTQRQQLSCRPHWTAVDCC